MWKLKSLQKLHYKREGYIINCIKEIKYRSKANLFTIRIQLTALECAMY